MARRSEMNDGTPGKPWPARVKEEERRGEKRWGKGRDVIWHATNGKMDGDDILQIFFCACDKNSRVFFSHTTLMPGVIATLASS